MNRPEDLTADSLKDAKVVQLRCWISSVNTTAGKRVLNISGKVAELKKRLADHFNLDVSAPAAPSAAKTTGIKRENEDCDDGIIAQQWLHLRMLGEEWGRCEAAGQAFMLGKKQAGSGLPSCLQAQLDTAVASAVSKQISTSSRCSEPLGTHPVSGVDADAIGLWLHSLQETGDQTALANLSRLSSMPPAMAAQAPSLSLSFITSPELTLSPLAVTSTSAPSSTPTQAVLAAGKAEIQAIERASGLSDILSQPEEVARLRKLYGPKTETREPSDPILKMALTRRERIYNELDTHFNGDSVRFLKFFTKDAPAIPKKRKRREDSGSNSPKPSLQPFRRVVVAIKRRNEDLSAERRKAEYLDTSHQFSSSLWHQRWADQNDWEVWRSLGKERY